MSEYETIKQGLILDRDGDPWYYGEEGTSCLEQGAGRDLEWLENVEARIFSPLGDLLSYCPKELKLPIEYMK